MTSQEKSLSNELGTTITNLTMFDNGFSFTVNSEFEAYKTAHQYQGCKETTVKYAPNVDKWSVQVYR